ncbi:hypothetical protein ACH665_00165, partial [Klebsiella pneumoniae]
QKACVLPENPASYRVVRTKSYLFNKAPKITHIVRRETIIINPNDARADWLKTFSTLVPFVSGKKNTRTRQIEIKAEAKPSLNEVKEIIEKYSSEEVLLNKSNFC